MPVDLDLAAERGELFGRPAGVGVQPRLTVPDERAQQRAQRPQTARDPGQQVRSLLGEDERARAGARVVEAHDYARHTTMTQPSRIWPWPTGISSRGSQRSNWQISPGRRSSAGRPSAVVIAGRIWR